MPGLERALLALLAAHAETIAVAFHDLQSGERVEIRAREPMHAASTMKLAVLLAAFRLHADLRAPQTVFHAVVHRFEPALAALREILQLALGNPADTARGAQP